MNTPREKFEYPPYSFLNPICENEYPYPIHCIKAEVYIDNGHTGTDFARPGFMRLMEDVRGGKMDCIVVRDLSRFGRNYIETGTYLERIFPKLGIRFISVKEQYDNFTADGSNESLAVPLQNLINDYYSKDISRKVSAALKVQRENGTYTWHCLPYGYRWNEDKSQIVPHEPYAGYVKEIFKRFLDGIPKNQIRKWLADSNIPSGFEVSGRGETNWTLMGVTSILNNQAYAGDKVLGKHRSAIYMGIKGQRVKNPEEWTIFENDHEPLVSREDFNAVQEIMKAQAEESRKKKAATEVERAKVTDLLAGKVFCPNCGGRIWMQKRRTSPQRPYYGGYECINYRISHYTVCTQHYFNQKLLYGKIVEAIKTQVQTALDYEVLIGKLRDSDAAKKMRDRLNAQIQSITLKMRRVNNKRAKLYEDYADGILDETEYGYAKGSYDTESERLNRMLDEAVERRNAFTDTLSGKNKWISMLKGVGEIGELTKELADAVIERVEIYDGGRFQLTMKYQDVYELTKRYIDELGEGATE